MRSLIIEWNNEWRWDYVWRKKYGISFNSEQHRNVSPLDIRFDLLEEQIVQNQIAQNKSREENLQHYKETGKWWKSSLEAGDVTSQEIENDLFDSINLDDFNTDGETD